LFNKPLWQPHKKDRKEPFHYSSRFLRLGLQTKNVGSFTGGLNLKPIDDPNNMMPPTVGNKGYNIHQL
jgi:hypothetical protein